MRMLPALSEKFGVNISELFSLAPRKDTSELSEDEIHLLHLYRRSRILPQNMRSALRETLETTISLYISTAKEMKDKVAQKNKKTVSRWTVAFLVKYVIAVVLNEEGYGFLSVILPAVLVPLAGAVI